MEGAGLLAGLVLATMLGLAVAVLVRGRSGTSPRRAVTTVLDEELFGEDAAELEALFATVAAEAVQGSRRLLLQRLEHLRGRGVPLRTVRAAPGPEVARLGFADGTVLLGRSVSAGDLAVALRLHHRGGLVVADYEDHAEGVLVRLMAPPGRRACRLIVLGVDQAD